MPKQRCISNRLKRIFQKLYQKLCEDADKVTKDGDRSGIEIMLEEDLDKKEIKNPYRFI